MEWMKDTGPPVGPATDLARERGDKTPLRQGVGERIDVAPPLLAKHLVLSGKHYDLEDVRDEIFLDLREGPGTQFLAQTCYGQAVIDCCVIGSDYYLLKVRPDMKGLLLSQLREVFKAFRVYRFAGSAGSRILLTDEVFIRFDPDAGLEARRTPLKRFFPGVEYEDDLEDGIYRLAGTFSEDPILVSNALQSSPVVLEVIPIVVAVPRPAEEAVEEGARARLVVPDTLPASL